MSTGVELCIGATSPARTPSLSFGFMDIPAGHHNPLAGAVDMACDLAGQAGLPG